MSLGLDWKTGDHQLCMIDEIDSLLRRGFVCYPEYELFLGNRNHKLIVDIYARKDNQEVIIEIGTLSNRSEGKERLDFLREIMSNAKIIWVQQWKNYGITESKIEMFAYYKKLQNISWERQEREQDAAMDFMQKQIKPQRR